MEFLKQNFNIDWVSTAKIENIDNKTISVSKGRNSLTLELNDGKTMVNLKIDGVETDEFTTKLENGKLKVHDHGKLVLHFNTQDAGIRCGDTLANLTGKTCSGQDIAGFDNTKTVGCGGDGSSGGGGGGGIGSVEPFYNTARAETIDGDFLASKAVKYTCSTLGLYEIDVTGSKNEYGVSITID